MKEVILLLVVLAVVSGTNYEPGVRVTFGYGPGRTVDYFHDVPRTLDKARANKWTQVQRPPSPLPSLVMWCIPEIHYICGLYDRETKFIKGLQIALPLNEFSGWVFDWNIQGFIRWTPPCTNRSEPITYMTKQMYFISEESLTKKSKKERLKADSSGKILQEDNLWLLGFNQKLMKVPKNATSLEKNDFYKQTCYPAMGQHYLYKLTPETKCAADTILNWFLLTDDHDGQLVGGGFYIVGRMPKKDGHKNYFELSTRQMTEIVIKYGPECILELADTNFLTNMHIYFVDEPWKIDCQPSQS